MYQLQVNEGFLEPVYPSDPQGLLKELLNSSSLYLDTICYMYVKEFEEAYICFLEALAVYIAYIIK